MLALASSLARPVLVGILILAPPLAHVTLTMHLGMDLTGVLVAAQASMVTWVASSSVGNRPVRAAACCASFLLVLWLWRLADDGPMIAAALPHAMAYATLLAFFLRSLAPGRESVATMLARRSRGHLPPAVECYTRRVTLFWCFYFAMQLAGSLLLLICAPPHVWSLLVNVLNFPLLLVTFCAEYIYRQWRHPTDPPEQWIDMVRMCRGMRIAAVYADRSSQRGPIATDDD